MKNLATGIKKLGKEHKAPMLASNHNRCPDLVVYGGSFDPPHLGHEYCIKSCLDVFPKTRMIVVPANAPVSGSKTLKPAAAGFDDRMQMCRLAFEALDDPRVVVSSIESEIEPPNYTLKTLRILKQKYPGQALCFLMGEDQWDNFSKWNEPLEVLSLASVFVVRRKASALSLKQRVEAVCAEIGLKVEAHENLNLVAIPSLEAFIYYQDIKPKLLASSDLRNSIAEQGKACSDEVSEEVESYIFSHGLYQ
ncbi:MAG: nicotinate (nicotinamide) nucleotide adenylyltransferase [Oligoflexales bacterium]|nr:nicotinate (nicotinamide) nucleotide adenylyltransferase [Oligoflexales bacterium]